MRTIEFLAPVEAMRGNLSGKQKLVYPTRNNSAWDAPDGVRSYARNYNARYIGSKNSQTLKNTFSVRRSNAVNISAGARQNMALMGGGKSVYDAMRANLTLRTQMDVFYRNQGAQTGWSEYKFFLAGIRTMLRTKSSVYSWGTSIKILNPWNDQATAGYTALSISEDILVKFWVQLNPTGVKFTIDNVETGIVCDEDTISDLVTHNTQAPNVLGLTLFTVEGTQYAKYGTMFLLDSAGDYINEEFVFTKGNEYKFTTTNVSPAQ